MALAATSSGCWRLLVPRLAQGYGSSWCGQRLGAVAEATCKQVSTSAATTGPQATGLRSLLKEYKQLSKARLSLLVALTASAGYAVGSGEAVDLAGLCWVTLGTFGAAACANTFNQLIEIKTDNLMFRTRNRPLPAGRIGRAHALAFAIGCGAAGLGLLSTQTNPLTTALGAANIFLYAGIYTPLKRLSIVNTWVGAVVGAIPPLMGWAAAASTLEPGAAVLAAILYFWQLPHFFALAWMCKEDYTRGGYRMLSVMDATGRRVAGVSVRNSLYLLPVGAAAVLLDVVSEPFAYEASALAAGMAVASAAFWLRPSTEAARKLFRWSLLYLPLTMAAMVVHRQPNTHAVGYEEAMRWVEGWVNEVVVPGVARVGVVATHTALRPVQWLAEVAGEPSSAVQCPSKAYGEGEEQGETTAEEGTAEQQQQQKTR